MKNKHIHDLVKQLHHDVRTAEENIKNLANDLTRVERIFEDLWKYVYKQEGRLAPNPQEQKLKCNTCGDLNKNYSIISSHDGYILSVECIICLKEKERALYED